MKNNNRKRRIRIKPSYDKLETRRCLSGPHDNIAQDISIFRDGHWYQDFEDDGYSGESAIRQFGGSGQQAVPGDFDGDGKDELGLFHDGLWTIDPNHNSYSSTTYWAFGLPGDQGISGDFDGDGTDEIGVFRNGDWYIDFNHNGYDGESRFVQFGLTGDQAVTGDFNGNGTDEIGVFRNGDWYIDFNHNGYDGETRFAQFGLPGDQAVAMNPFGCAFVSFELEDAPCASSSEKRVQLWLKENRQLILDAEVRFDIDRRAIAGVIAHEALVNPRESWVFDLPGVRGAAGPGKVHYRNNHILGEGNPVSKQIEGTHQFGEYISSKSMLERKAWTETTFGAIEYIAGYMNGFASVFESAGYQGVRSQPEILANVYHGSSLGDQLVDVLGQLTAEFPKVREYTLESESASLWLSQNFGFIESAVGKPAEQTEFTYTGTVRDDEIMVNDHSKMGPFLIHTNSFGHRAFVYLPRQLSKITILGAQGNDFIGVNTSIDSVIRGGAGNDSLNGGNASDRIFGEDGNDSIFGGNGDDRLWGGAGDDAINGHSGNNFIYGEGGNDRLRAWYGNDRIEGGSGDDQMWGSAGNDSLDGGDGNDQVFGEDGDDDLFGGNGNDRLWGGVGDDAINGHSGNNFIYGEGGNDRLWAWYGNDRIEGGSGNDQMWGNAGNDSLDGGDGNDRIYGEDGNDVIAGGHGDDHLEGGNQDDQIWGGTGNDTINGNAGNDGVYGQDGNDTMFGGAGDDDLRGDSGNDRIYAGLASGLLYSGNDVLRGGDGTDTLFGQSGHNWLIGGDGSDIIYGGVHPDTILDGNYLNGRAHADQAIDRIFAGSGDVIFAQVACPGHSLPDLDQVHTQNGWLMYIDGQFNLPRDIALVGVDIYGNYFDPRY